MKLVLFDLDHTLIPFDSGSTWFRYLIHQGRLEADVLQQNQRFAEDYMQGKLDITAFQRFAMAPLARFSRRDLASWQDAFLTAVHPAIPASTQALVQNHLQAGDLCALVTTTNSFVAGGFAKLFAIPHLLASEIATHGEGPDARYTGEPHGPPCFQEGKIHRVESWLRGQGQEWGTFSDTLFYSDSINDLPLLQKVRTPIAVQPDAKLRHIAQTRGWRILDCHGPAVPPPFSGVTASAQSCASATAHSTDRTHIVNNNLKQTH